MVLKSVMMRPMPMNWAAGGRVVRAVDGVSGVEGLEGELVDVEGTAKTPKLRLLDKTSRMAASGSGLAQYMSGVAHAALTSETEIRDELVVMR